MRLKAPAIRWPYGKLTAVALADAIDHYVRRSGIVAVSLDGPQGWRDPETRLGTPGVGRRCEYECRTQAKVGTYPRTFPSNQRAWVEFSIELFASLLARPGVRLAATDTSAPMRGDGYVVLESFPTSLWRTAGLAPLPAKARKPDLRPFARSLFAAFRIASPADQIASHDDLQAVVAAIAAAAFAGGPAIPVPRGVPAVPRHTDGREMLTEGLIWDARPLVSREQSEVLPPTASKASATISGTRPRRRSRHERPGVGESQ